MWGRSYREACPTNTSQVYSLDTYERRRVIHAHKGSVLGLCLSQDQKLLFSSAADPIVNVGTYAISVGHY